MFNERKNKKELLELSKGNVSDSLYDLDIILQKISELSDNNIKYDVLIHRFFEDEIGHMGIPNGWFCHIITWEYDAQKDDYFKNLDKGVKVFGCTTPKSAVIEALRVMFSREKYNTKEVH